MRDGIKKRIDTTLGDLMESLGEVAFEYCKDSTKAYSLVGVVLADLLSNCSRSDLIPIRDARQEILDL